MALQSNKRVTTVVLLLALFVMLNGSYSVWTLRIPFEMRDSSHGYGFETVDCWFEVGPGWPVTECYYMYVPENHDRPDARAIAFPVVVFRSSSLISMRRPVLHLGAGGPGAPMYLDSTQAVRAAWEYHDAFSLKQGRDLFVIDPRGTGLAKPLLTCDIFVDNITQRLARNLSLEEEMRAADADYHRCIDDFKTQDIDLAAYNSLSIAHDIELMRKAAGVDGWVLVGVSYSTRYAQLIATEYPGTVEAMVLDSAVFPNLQAHDNFLEQALAPYRALYNHCDADPDCEYPLLDAERKVATLHKRLNQRPIETVIAHPYEDAHITVAFNGERFIETLLDAIYDVEIFSDLPQIVFELEQGENETIKPYLENYVAYLLDRNYGDVSAGSHYCFEERPFTNFERMRGLVKSLPAGHIRDTVKAYIGYPDYCDRMGIAPGPQTLVEATQTDIPSLFLQGELDTVTPPGDVRSQLRHFTNSRLVTYPVSHGVMLSQACAEDVAAKFIQDPEVQTEELDCRG